MRENRCENCKHWCPASEFDSSPEANVFSSDGECRRRAPSIPWLGSVSTFKERGRTHNIYQTSTFPPTRAGDWCSEHEAK